MKFIVTVKTVSAILLFGLAVASNTRRPWQKMCPPREKRRPHGFHRHHHRMSLTGFS